MTSYCLMDKSMLSSLGKNKYSLNCIKLIFLEDLEEGNSNLATCKSNLCCYNANNFCKQSDLRLVFLCN